MFILARIIYWLAQQKVQFMKHFLNGVRLNIGVKGKLSTHRKGDVTRDDSQRRFLVPNRFKYWNNVAAFRNDVETML